MLSEAIHALTEAFDNLQTTDDQPEGSMDFGSYFILLDVLCFNNAICGMASWMQINITVCQLIADEITNTS